MRKLKTKIFSISTIFLLISTISFKSNPKIAHHLFYITTSGECKAVIGRAITGVTIAPMPADAQSAWYTMDNSGHCENMTSIAYVVSN